LEDFRFREASPTVIRQMEDKALPKSYGEELTLPVLFPEQEELCVRLDEFCQSSGNKLEFQLSSLLRGALYTMRYKENPDWMAQVAHSLREILYSFKGKGWRDAFARYGSTHNKRRIGPDVGIYYNFFSDIAHHGFGKAGTSQLIGGTKDKPVVVTAEIFEKVVLGFGQILFTVLRRQIEAHQEIDAILALEP
jgi:hypothetical protein